MEHRCSDRIPIELDVIIRRRESELGRYKTRDLSCAGAFIKTGSIDLSAGDYVNITLIADQAGFKDQYLNALVIHRFSHGMGLMFVGHSANDVRALKSLIDRAA